MMSAILRSIFPIWLIILYLNVFANGLNILGLFPHPGISHQVFFTPVMRGLADAGHDVTVISYFPEKSPPPKYKDLSLGGGVKNLTNTVDLQLFENRPFYSHFTEFFLLYEWGKTACETTLNSNALATVLKAKKKYDVIIMEQFNTDCMMAIAHVLKSPVIAMSSCALMPWHYRRIGNPHNPSYIPALWVGQSENMSFFGRLGNWITIHAFNFMYSYFSDNTATELARRKFGKDIPDIGDLAKETSLLFVNQHFSLSGAKPISPAVIELAGIHIQKAKTLDADLQKLLDSAEHGVIYFSWGSMIRAETLPVKKRDAFLKAFSRLKQTVLWKWENETLPNKPDNVHIRKWMPQRDILCHPNVKVFISHAGLMGSIETAYCGVPAVVTPMYGDQFLNAAALVHRGMGTLLKYDDITETTVYKSLKNALNPKSLDNAKTISYSFRFRPKEALETAIWWVEYVAKTEGAPLTKSTSTFLPWYVYYCVDIYLFIAVICFVVVQGLKGITKKFCSPKKVRAKKD